MLVAALVVLVVNAQLTWWIIFVLRENRERLVLERGRLVACGAAVATRIRVETADAAAAVQRSLLAGSEPGRDLSPPAFSSWRWSADCARGWQRHGGEIVLAVPADGRCAVAVASDAFVARLLRVGPELEVAAATDATVRAERPGPQVLLPAPFADRVVRPRLEAWDRILRDYRGRITMIVSEGAFFAILLFVMIALLWKTLRREVELERQHRNFLSAITHELKSPLASIRLSLETVLRGRAQGEASVRFMENALQDAERLQSLVQKVLEVTRFGADARTLELQPSCLSDVVERAAARFSRLATVAGVRLEATLEPDVWAEIDAEAFAIVLSNLLENAVKYGGAIPKVDIALRRRDGRAIIDVSDNGGGIADEELSFIFNRFYRGGDEMTRTTHGTGLGLFLVRQIVNAHGGSVGVAATGPEGTTFRVELPTVAAPEET